MSEKIQCPYCNHQFEYEAEAADQDETLHIECHQCDKEFVGTAHYEFYIDNIEKADCLNNGEHILRESIGIPKGFPMQYRCQLCDDHGRIEKFKRYRLNSLIAVKIPF